jgi:serine/threonine protein kinase
LDENGELKIADFGLARDIDVGEILMTKGACTPLYAAPEVLKLETYDSKCDVWSAGLILYEMLTAKEFFGEVKTKKQLIKEI